MSISDDPVRQDYILEAVERYKEIIDADTDEIDSEAIKEIDRKLTNDERLFVAKLLTDKAKGSKRMYKNIVKDCINEKPGDRDV